MVITITLFLIGFFILIKGAGLLTDGASVLARRLKISELVIGLVVVGIGGSIPEFSISLLANLVGNGDIGLGTLIGSNIFSILFILGISAFFFPLKLKKIWVERDLIWNILAVLVAAFFVVFQFFGSEGFVGISSGEGLILLAIFLLWLIYTVKNSNGLEPDGTGTKRFHMVALHIAFGMMFFGFLGILLGGKWVVDGAIMIARQFGLSESFIGLTILGIGSSLPEFSVALVAAQKKESGLAVGSIIGSNIFDFLMILGIGSLARPIIFSRQSLIDMFITAASAFLLFCAMFIGKKYTLKRWQGFLFIFLYIGYILLLVRMR